MGLWELTLLCIKQGTRQTCMTQKWTCPSPSYQGLRGEVSCKLKVHGEKDWMVELPGHLLL